MNERWLLFAILAALVVLVIGPAVAVLCTLSFVAGVWFTLRHRDDLSNLNDPNNPLRAIERIVNPKDRP